MSRLAARDIDGFAALCAADFTHSDRRRLNRLEANREQFLAGLRRTIELSSSMPKCESRRHARRSPGAVALSLARRRRRSRPDRDRAAGAPRGGHTRKPARLRLVRRRRPSRPPYAELDARWEAGEGAANPGASGWFRRIRADLDRRDWQSMLSHYAPDFVANDHRLVGWGTRRGGPAFTEALRSMIDLAPDARLRADHDRVSGRAILLDNVWTGTRDGGAFESAHIGVTEVDAHGRALRFDAYDPHRIDEAFARFEEIAAAAAPSSIARGPQGDRNEAFENAATRTVDRDIAAFETRDWDGMRALFAANFRAFDRTRLAQLEADREQWLEGYRQMIEMTTSRPSREIVATRGERLAILRVHWQGAEGDVGPSEMDWLLVNEVDERGDHLATVLFDPDDVDAAYDRARGALRGRRRQPERAHFRGVPASACGSELGWSSPASESRDGG